MVLLPLILPGPNAGVSSYCATLGVGQGAGGFFAGLYGCGGGAALPWRVSSNWPAALAGLLGIAFAGGAGGVLNQIVEPELDQHMRRTHRRPLAEGRIGRKGAIVYATVLLSVSTGAVDLDQSPDLGADLAWHRGVWRRVYPLPRHAVEHRLGRTGGCVAAVDWLDRSDRPGGLAATVSGGLDLRLDPSAFWPLAIYCRRDYAKACIPMLPVTHGVDRTRKEILVYAVATWLVSLVPAFLNHDWIYGGIAWIAGAWFVGMALRLRKLPEAAEMDLYARKMFAFSIAIYSSLLRSGKALLGYGIL